MKRQKFHFIKFSKANEALSTLVIKYETVSDYNWKGLGVSFWILAFDAGKMTKMCKRQIVRITFFSTKY